MAKSLTAPLSIINLVELAMSIIIGGLIAELSPGLNVTKSQFVTAIGYGYIIVNCLVVASIFLKDELPKNTRLLIACSAIIMYVTCGALILEFFDKWESNPLFSNDDEKYGRVLSAGIFSIALAALYIADLFFVYKS